MALGEEPRPHGVRKVQGAGRAYRVRQGDYRLVYDDERLVLILHAGNRGQDNYR